MQTLGHASCKSSHPHAFRKSRDPPAPAAASWRPCIGTSKRETRCTASRPCQDGGASMASFMGGSSQSAGSAAAAITLSCAAYERGLTGCPLGTRRPLLRPQQEKASLPHRTARNEARVCCGGAHARPRRPAPHLGRISRRHSARSATASCSAVRPSSFPRLTAIHLRLHNTGMRACARSIPSAAFAS